ncbi:MAG TPA: hypothetical protein VE934_06750 [Polaromonas sp.]|uniref:hypothetical protein n=1 Tax=Polaromonas sp. TaxID=1869339 RepID=UPI002D66D6AF|nr:hypothetical protein [Polaromonas sp.]HYW56639.1 hypothetical protein [Polaromonas sp.]
MANEIVRRALISAIENDQLNTQRIRWRYAALTTRINAYMDKTGPAPTAEEFEQWRADGMELSRLASLTQGVEASATESMDMSATFVCAQPMQSAA